MRCSVAQEAKEAPEPAEAQAVPKGGEAKTFSMEEVEKHDTRESAWFVHAGQVRACCLSPDISGFEGKPSFSNICGEGTRDEEMIRKCG